MDTSKPKSKPWNALPPASSRFLTRATLLFASWKLLYILWMLPMKEPDNRLVRWLGESTASTLNLFEGERLYRVRYENSNAFVYRLGHRADIKIARPCNGLELMVLAAGFILCFDGGRGMRKSAYVAVCILGVFFVNVARCTLLTMVKTSHPVYFDFIHKYLFSLACYGFVFLIWMRYVNGLMQKPVSADSL